MSWSVYCVDAVERFLVHCASRRRVYCDVDWLCRTADSIAQWVLITPSQKRQNSSNKQIVFWGQTDKKNKNFDAMVILNERKWGHLFCTVFFLVGFWPFWGLLLLAIATFIPSAAEWIQIVVLRIYMWPSTSLVIFIIIWCCVCVVSLLLLSRSIFLFTSPSFCFVFFCFVQPLIKMMTGTWLPEMPAGHGSLISHDRHHHTYVANYSRSSTKQSDSSFDYPIHLGQHQLEKMCPLNVRK